MSDAMHAAMKSVLEDMGRAAREGKARRFSKRGKNRGVEVKVGEVSLSPNSDMDVAPDSTADGMSADELRELESELQVQR